MGIIEKNRKGISLGNASYYQTLTMLSYFKLFLFCEK